MSLYTKQTELVNQDAILPNNRLELVQIGSTESFGFTAFPSTTDESKVNLDDKDESKANDDQDGWYN